MVKIKCPYWGTPTGCPFSGNYICGEEPCSLPAESNEDLLELAKKVYGEDYLVSP